MRGVANAPIAVPHPFLQPALAPSYVGSLSQQRPARASLTPSASNRSGCCLQKIHHSKAASWFAARSFTALTPNTRKPLPRAHS